MLAILSTFMKNLCCFNTVLFNYSDITKAVKQICYMFLPPCYFLCEHVRLKPQSCYPTFSEFSLVSIVSTHSPS